MEILWNFQGDFWKNLQIITETSNNFIEELQRNPKEILEIFVAPSKICPGRFKALSGTENSANIFGSNILLVIPLTTYFMKMMFASLLVFLRRVYIKNKISINIDIIDIFRKILINISIWKNFWYSHHYHLLRINTFQVSIFLEYWYFSSISTFQVKKVSILFNYQKYQHFSSIKIIINFKCGIL